MTLLRLFRPGALTLATLFALLLAACGQDADTPETAGTTKGAVPAETTSAEPSPAAEQTRSVSGKFGEVDIPVRPQRIAGLYLEDNLSALGFEPVVKSEPYDYLELSSPLFNMYEGNPEGLLAARPDLILLSFWYDEQIVAEFGKIAPTVVFDWEWGEDGWREQLKGLAELLGEEEKAERILGEYEAKAEQVRTAIHEAIGDKTVAFLRVDPGRLMLYGDDRGGGFVGPIVYGDLGLAPPAIVREMTWGKRDPVVISEELIPDIDADYLFLINDESDDQSKKALADLEQSPVWRNVSAVQTGQVYSADSKIWLNNGIRSNEAKLDFLQSRLKP